jgi:hypothetical protein
MIHKEMRMEKNFVTPRVALAAVTKTLIGAVTVPLGVSKLVEVGTMLDALGVTTLYSYSHLLEVECDNATSWAGNQQFAIGGPVILGTAAFADFKSTPHDCNIDVQPGMVLNFSVTAPSVPTINPSCRAFGKFK